MKREKKQFSAFNRFYRVMIVPGLALFLITSYINLTGSLQPYPEPNNPTGYPLLFRMAGTFLFGPISIGLGWMLTRKFKHNLIGPVLFHWGCATSPNLGHSILSPLWGAISLYYSMVVVLPGMVLTLASFPSGRGVTPFWDRVMKGLVLLLMGVCLFYNLVTPVAYGTSAPSPLAIQALTRYFGVDELNSLITLVLGISFVTGSSLTIYRYWITHEAERKQMRWLLGIGIYFAVFIPIGTSLQRAAGSLEGVVTIITLIFLFNVPSLGISLAILQHHLWDIDVIIRKTVQYGAVTAVLSLIYFGTVIMLQSVVGRATGEQSTFVIVLSTLLIAGLFNPLRGRVQTAVDRRFYRQKYDPAQVLADFAQVARDETDMTALQAELLRVVQESLQPETVSIWLKK